MNQFLLVVMLFAVAACATPNPEPTQFQAVQYSEVVPAEESANGMPANNADTQYADNKMADANNADGIEEFKAPTVSEIPAEMIPNRPVPEPAIVCERVVPTGSVLPMKVCRHQDDIDRKQAADQEIFDDIKRNTALGNSRL